jgi:hypothetical protein
MRIVQSGVVFSKNELEIALELECILISTRTHKPCLIKRRLLLKCILAKECCVKKFVISRILNLCNYPIEPGDPEFALKGMHSKKFAQFLAAFRTPFQVSLRSIFIRQHLIWI